MTKLIIVEDNAFALQAISDKLANFSDIVISYVARNGQEVLEFLKQNNSVDLILMDIEMPVMNGIEATQAIKQKYPQIKIVMITVYDDDNYIFDAIKAGADSYILKETKAEKIFETITDTLNGGAVMSPSIAVKTLRLLKNAPIVEKTASPITIELTGRETEILEQLSTGISNKTIAEKLFISPFTVKRHIENIYQKLQAHNRIELIEKARQNKLL
ncbi:MAG: response regulator transcription factor [Bacteroidia bacterium]|nr:response regulator transcription factor [Bacteroidia bacterium]MCZ2249183.1 response regulator transcription factor [Bacteroidia bacterium]